jgi:hypothetical protein
VDELEIKGKKYISSKRAAEITGYAKDYIGQLARAGKVAGTRFGRAWYVDETALLTHFKAESKQAPTVAVETAPAVPLRPLKPVLGAHHYKPYAFPKTWGEVKYLADESELLPVISKPIPPAVAEIPNKNIVSSDSLDTKSAESSIITGVRIKILNDGLIPKNAITRLPQIEQIAEKKTSVPTQRRSKVRHVPVSLLPVAVFAGSVAFFFLAVSGLFFSSETSYAPSHDTYTASVLLSFDHIWELFRASPLIEVGVSGISGFFDTLFDLFWVFFQTGIDFLASFHLG